MSALAIYLPTVVFISLLGGFLPLMRALSQRALALLLSFSAGVLLGAVFFHMLPEVGNLLGANLGLPVLAGFPADLCHGTFRIRTCLRRA